MTPLLDISGALVRLGEFVLGPLTLSLWPGDYLLLLGPSGCGKTSLLRAVAGVHPIESGRMAMDGRDLGGIPTHRRGLGYVAQTADLFPHLSVAQNVAFGLAYVRAGREEKQRRFHATVALLGLEGLLDRTPGTLSGGEGRRVALARSLVVGPRLLLLDEPLSMLDYNARAGMIEALKRVHAELGTATVHVTHDREEAWTFGGRCAVMRGGRIEQVGRVDELFRRPQSRFVAEFLGGANVFPARFEGRAGQWVAVLDGAELALRDAVPFAQGCVQVRPETLTATPQPGADSLGGTVLSVAERGIYCEVRLRLGSGQVLCAHLAPSACARLRESDALKLWLTAPPHPFER